MKKNITANRLIRKIDDFPPLPTVVSKIIQLTADKNSSIDDLQKIISMEISLATSVLKMANSPFFGISHQVTSLQHAVSVLGMNEIRNLVLVRAMFQTFKEVKKQASFDHAFLWKHSFYCAMTSQLIAGELGLNKNDFFVAGLIHDVGKLILFLELPTETLETIQFTAPSTAATLDAERRFVGIGHDELGMRLLQKWMFPKNLVASVGFHHHPLHAQTETMFPLLVCISNSLSHILTAPDIDQGKMLIETILQWPFLDSYESIGLSITEKWLADHIIHLNDNLAEEQEMSQLF